MNIKIMTMKWFLVLLFTSLIITSCSNNDNPTNPNSKNNSTNIIVTINSNIVVPKLMLIGKDKTYNLSTTDTLQNITPGTFTLIAERVDVGSTSGNLVGKSYGVIKPVQQFQVAEGETKEINLTYTELPASGKLWLSDDTGSQLLAFANSKLITPGSPSPDTKITFSFEGLRGFAFDKMGNLWVAGFSSSKLFVFTPDQLSNSSTASPLLTITDNSISGPYGLIFDYSGNLWISNWNSGTIISYNLATIITLLTKSGNISSTPDITLTSTKLKEPEFMAFDFSGNLWIAGSDPSSNKSEIIKYPSTSLKTSGEILPTVTITESSQPTLINVSGLAFDKSGNLWGTDGNSFFRFSPNQLISSGATIPQLYKGVPSPALLTGLAFDAQSNLWMSETYSPRLIRYTYPNSGYGTTYNSSNSLNEPNWICIFPPPSGLPIK